MSGVLTRRDFMRRSVAGAGVEIVGVYDAYKGRIERAIERTHGRAKEYVDDRTLLADTWAPRMSGTSAET